jgi:hypothetical protein
MTLPNVHTDLEKRLMRLILEAYLRKMEPNRGPWWYPLEEAIGIPLGSINPDPPKAKVPRYEEADFAEFDKSIKNGHYKPVHYPA